MQGPFGCDFKMSRLILGKFGPEWLSSEGHTLAASDHGHGDGEEGLEPPAPRVEPGFPPGAPVIWLPAELRGRHCTCSADPCWRSWMGPSDPRLEELQGAGPGF